MKKIITFALSLLLGMPSFAQSLVNEADYRETVTVSLDEARAYAVQNNRSLQNADFEVQMAHAQRWQAIASMLPQADMSMTYQNMCGYEMNMSGFKIPMNPNGTISITASIALNGQMVVGALLSNIAIEMQEINNKKTEADLIADVESMYITALAMEETIGLLDSSKTNLQELYKTIAGAVAVGAAEQTEADQIEVQVASLDNTINSTRRSVEIIYNSLALSLGCGPERRLVLTDKLDDLLKIDDAVALLKTDFDITNNYQYQLAEKNVELANHNVVMAAMAYVPTLSAYYQYSAKTYFNKDAGMNMTPPNVIGVTLSVPLWTSGAKAAAVHEKKIAKFEAENQRDDARDALLLSYRQSRYNLISAYENFDTQKKNIEVMQRVMTSTSNKYQYGMASAFDLTNASTNLLTAHSNYVQAILTLVSAQADMKKILDKTIVK